MPDFNFDEVFEVDSLPPDLVDTEIEEESVGESLTVEDTIIKAPRYQSTNPLKYATYKNQTAFNTRFKSDPMLKKSGIRSIFSEQTEEEWIRCRDDVVYFISNYMRIVHVDFGTVMFNLWDYQKEFIEHIDNNRFTIAKCPRQIGKSIISVGYILHYIIFNKDKVAVILANKADTANGILSRLKNAYKLLPDFLQHGVVEWNKTSIELENGCIVKAYPTSSSSARSQSIGLLFVDEVAFIEKNIWDEFWKSVYPTISSGKETKIILVSTPNGFNHFCYLWQNATNKISTFAPFSIHWNMVPGRNEKWKVEQIANTSEEDFRQEHECEFLGSARTLIKYEKLIQLVEGIEPPIDENYADLIIARKPQPEHRYIVTVDAAEGRGQDYSAISVIDVTKTPYHLSAIYRSNVISPLILPSKIKKICEYYNNAYALLEIDSVGGMVAYSLFHVLEYDNMINFGSDDRLGIKTTRLVKSVGCSTLKDFVESDQLVITIKEVIDELNSFIEEKLSWEAEAGFHDDLVATLFIFAYFTTMQEASPFIEQDRDITGTLFEDELMAQYEDQLGFFIMNTGDSITSIGSGKLGSLF